MRVWELYDVQQQMSYLPHARSVVQHTFTKLKLSKAQGKIETQRNKNQQKKKKKKTHRHLNVKWTKKKETRTFSNESKWSEQKQQQNTTTNKSLNSNIFLLGNLAIRSFTLRYSIAIHSRYLLALYMGFQCRVYRFAYKHTLDRIVYENRKQRIWMSFIWNRLESLKIDESSEQNSFPKKLLHLNHQ